MQTRNSKGVETCNSHIYFFPMLLNIHLQGTIFGTEKKRSIWPIKFDGYENDTEKVNRPFLSSPGLCIKTRLGAQPWIGKWVFIVMQIKLIFTRKVVHLASGKRGMGLGGWRTTTFLVIIFNWHNISLHNRYKFMEFNHLLSNRYAFTRETWAWR